MAVGYPCCDAGQGEKQTKHFRLRVFAEPCSVDAYRRGDQEKWRYHHYPQHNHQPVFAIDTFHWF
jgi:hypothetical protein